MQDDDDNKYSNNIYFDFISIILFAWFEIEVDVKCKFTEPKRIFKRFRKHILSI